MEYPPGCVDGIEPNRLYERRTFGGPVQTPCFFSAAILCFNQLSFKNNAATSFRSEKIYFIYTHCWKQDIKYVY